MWFDILKFVSSAALIVAVSEVSKHSSLFGGLLASLPLVSLLSILWLYGETKSTELVAGLSNSIFWMVLPTLPLFLVLPFLLKKQVPFYGAFFISCAVTVCGYYGLIHLLHKLGIRL